MYRISIRKIGYLGTKIDFEIEIIVMKTGLVGSLVSLIMYGSHYGLQGQIFAYAV